MKLEKLILILLGLLLPLIIIEIGLRVVDPKKTNLQFYDNKIFGHALVPNQKGWFTPHTKEYSTWVEVNSHGWPDVEHNYKKDSSTYRILILGDSFVENTQVALENRFFRQLENKLIAQGKKVEVIALGRGNTGTAQQYLILKHYGILYNPDLVVHMFLTANDIKNNSPVLQSDPYLPYYRLTENNTLELIPQTSRSERKYAMVKDQLKAVRIVEELLWIRQQYQERQRHTKTNYPLDYHVYDKTYTKDFEDALAVTKKLILETKLETEKVGSKYILVTLANNEQIHKDVQDRIYQSYPEFKTNNIDFEKPDKLLQEFCSKEQLTCLSMLSYFKEYVDKNSGAKTHFTYEGHWNQSGTDLAATFLTERLIEYINDQK